MQLELKVIGTPEEISSITSFIQQKSEREANLFKPVFNPDASLKPMPTEKKKFARTDKVRKRSAIEVHVGSPESGYVLHKTFNSIKDAAVSVGCKAAANIFEYIDTDRPYKKIYKFFRKVEHQL